MRRLLTRTLTLHRLASGLRTSNSRTISLLTFKQSTLPLCSSPVSARGIRKNSDHASQKLSLDDVVENKKGKENEGSTLGHDADASITSPQPPHSIYVGQIPWHIDNDRLIQEFSACGEIVSGHIRTSVKSGKSRGFGFIQFSTSEGVENALKMNGKELDGRAIHVKKRERQENPPSKTLFVGDLPLSASDESVREMFNEWDVKKVRLMRHRETGKALGIALVEFRRLEDAQAALDTMRVEGVDGRPLKLDFSRKKLSVNRSGRGGSRGGRGGPRGGSGGFDGGSQDRRSEGSDS